MVGVLPLLGQFQISTCWMRVVQARWVREKFRWNLMVHSRLCSHLLFSGGGKTGDTGCELVHKQCRMFMHVERGVCTAKRKVWFHYLVMEQIIVRVNANDYRPEHQLALQHLRTQVAIVTSHVKIICPQDVTSERCMHWSFLLQNLRQGVMTQTYHLRLSPESCARVSAPHCMDDDDGN